MKRFIPYSLIAAALACGLASAQTTAYTTPVGYTSQTLKAGLMSVAGINVLTPTLVQGTITSVAFVGTAPSDTTVVTVSGADFVSALPAGRTCIFEVLSGTQAGAIQDFVTWSTTTITLPGTVTGLSTDSYRVRVAPTLQELFPVGLLKGAANATSADVVWLPNGLGAYTLYWYKTSAPNIGWHLTGTGTNDLGPVSSGVPLVYNDGLLVQKKTGTDTSLVLSGEVKTTATKQLLAFGINVLGITPPVGLTLFTCGLQAGAANATSADTIWVPNGLGAYTLYWYKTNAPNIGWHTTGTGTNDLGLVSGDVVFPAGVLVNNKKPAKTVALNVPTSYAGL
ncbi:MAG: hypothetical protein WCJ23_06745 [Verrucomicrobiota bacterium]